MSGFGGRAHRTARYQFTDSSPQVAISSNDAAPAAGIAEFKVTGSGPLTTITSSTPPGSFIKIHNATGGSLTLTNTAVPSAEGQLSLGANIAMASLQEIMLKKVLDISAGVHVWKPVMAAGTAGAIDIGDIRADGARTP